MNQDRFNKARELLITNKIVLEKSGKKADYFKVGEYDVTISDSEGCSCSCEYMVWSLKNKHLLCSHILAALCSYVIMKYEIKEN